MRMSSPGGRTPKPASATTHPPRERTTAPGANWANSCKPSAGPTGPSRALLHGQRLHLGAADGAEQHRIGSGAKFLRLRRQWGRPPHRWRSRRSAPLRFRGTRLAPAGPCAAPPQQRASLPGRCRHPAGRRFSLLRDIPHPSQLGIGARRGGQSSAASQGPPSQMLAPQRRGSAPPGPRLGRCHPSPRAACGGRMGATSKAISPAIRLNDALAKQIHR